MGTQRVDTLVLEIDMGGGADGFLKGIGADQRCGTIVFIHLQHWFGDINPRMYGIKFLFGALQTENGGQILCLQRLVSSGMDWRQGLVGHLSLNVIPLRWNLVLLENKSFLSCHNYSV